MKNKKHKKGLNIIREMDKNSLYFVGLYIERYRDEIGEEINENENACLRDFYDDEDILNWYSYYEACDLFFLNVAKSIAQYALINEEIYTYINQSEMPYLMSKKMATLVCKQKNSNKERKFQIVTSYSLDFNVDNKTKYLYEIIKPNFPKRPPYYYEYLEFISNLA